MAGTSPGPSTPRNRKTDDGWDTSKETYAEYALRRMREAGVAPTRENYLMREFGDKDYVPDAEQELDMPPQFRRLLPPDPTE